MYKGNISDTRWKEKLEVNRANHSLSLKAMHKEIAWLFRCRHTVMHDFRPLSYTDACISRGRRLLGPNQSTGFAGG